MTIYASGLGVVSCLGNDRRGFLDALNGYLRDGLTAADLPAFSQGDGAVSQSAAEPAEEHSTAPYPAAAVVPAQPFDIAQILGQRKGTRVLDRLAQLAVGACTHALRDAGVAPAGREDDIGVVLGTQNGSLSQVAQFLRETYTLEKPWMISPETFPNTVMNFAAGQCAIWHKLRAVNTTISGGGLSGLSSLKYALRMLQHGRAVVMLAGGAEELTPETAWYYSAARGGKTFTRLGEGAAMVCLSSEKRPGNGAGCAVEIAACEIAHSASPDRTVEILQASVDRALARAGCLPAQIDYVVSGLGDEREGDASAEHAVIERLFAGCMPAHVPMRHVAGECFSANTALQLVAACLLLEQAGPGRTALVTGVSEQGNLGCAVIRTGEEGRGHA
jgi:3-oxoacyl-[acyl-carrier-protein] synthase II